MLSQIRDILDDRLADQTADRAGSAFRYSFLNEKEEKERTIKAKNLTRMEKEKKRKDGEGNLLDTMSDLSKCSWISWKRSWRLC